MGLTAEQIEALLTSSLKKKSRAGGSKTSTGQRRKNYPPSRNSHVIRAEIMVFYDDYVECDVCGEMCNVKFNRPLCLDHLIDEVSSMYKERGGGKDDIVEDEPQEIQVEAAKVVDEPIEVYVQETLAL